MMSSLGVGAKSARYHIYVIFLTKNYIFHYQKTVFLKKFKCRPHYFLILNESAFHKLSIATLIVALRLLVWNLEPKGSSGDHNHTHSGFPAVKGLTSSLILFRCHT